MKKHLVPKIVNGVKSALKDFIYKVWHKMSIMLESQHHSTKRQLIITSEDCSLKHIASCCREDVQSSQCIIHMESSRFEVVCYYLAEKSTMFQFSLIFVIQSPIFCNYFLRCTGLYIYWSNTIDFFRCVLLLYWCLFPV